MADQNQLSRDILRIAIEQNIQIVDADQSQSSNQQQNDDAMEAIIFFEKELGILPKNNPEAIPAPPSQNPNSVKPEDAKVHDAKWANLFDDEYRQLVLIKPTIFLTLPKTVPAILLMFPNIP